jgi:ferrous iron transport protein B
MSNFALIGCPNTGKTSLFNALTGSYGYVGNWSGVTVEKKVGTFRGRAGQLIDLPGIYDINPISEDETVVTTYLLDEATPLLNIVDASQMERHLDLTVQVLEMARPLVIGLNMLDIADNRGIHIDVAKLAKALGVAVYAINARKSEGTAQLTTGLDAVQPREALQLNYGALEPFLHEVAGVMAGAFAEPRWVALQLAARNRVVERRVKAKFADQYPLWQMQLGVLEAQIGKTLAQHMYQVRKAYITKVFEAATTTSDSFDKIPLSERVDRIVTHRYFGMPIFFLLMYLMFQLTFTWVGAPLSNLFSTFLDGPLTNGVVSALHAMGVAPFIKDLIVGGIIAGVGGVLVFVPQIFVIFLCISFLEDSGYMSRIAVVMDRLFSVFGLNGKAFIPMIIGFGCNVPGIMAARTIEQPKERLLTILVTPFMSCSARLPVYALFAGAFFKHDQALIVTLLYATGIIVALSITKVLSMTIMKKETSLFIMELPPYRMPQGLTLWRSTWEKGKGFVRKAGTFIFTGSVIIFLLNYMGPSGFNAPMGDSFLARIGDVLAPVFAPLGFGTWQAVAALVTGFLAKEVVVSSMSIIYGVGSSDLMSTLAHTFTPHAAFAFIFFVLLYVPCLATVAVIRRETCSTKWTTFAVVYPLLLAYVLTFAVYQVLEAFF